MNVRISDHAKDHMKDCGISEQDVRDLFDEKIKAVKTEASRKYDDCVEMFAVLSGKFAKVVYSYETNCVVTTFKLRKKQWEKLTKQR
jgi:hypothetical protein